MARANDDVEQALLEFADLLSILTTDPHKPRAYEKAARSVGGYHADISTLDQKGILQIPNVGKSIAEKIVELLQTGTFADLEALRAQIPPGVRELMSIPASGRRRRWCSIKSWGSRPSPNWLRRSRTNASPPSRGSEARRRRTSSAVCSSCRTLGARPGERGARRGRGAPRRAQRAEAGPPGDLRRIPSPDARDDRRRRPPGRERERRAHHGRVRGATLGRPG